MLLYRTGAVRRLLEASSECGSRQYARADKTTLMGCDGGKLVFATFVVAGGVGQLCRRRESGAVQPNLARGRRVRERHVHATRAADDFDDGRARIELDPRAILQGHDFDFPCSGGKIRAPKDRQLAKAEEQRNGRGGESGGREQPPPPGCPRGAGQGGGNEGAQLLQISPKTAALVQPRLIRLILGGPRPERR